MDLSFSNLQIKERKVGLFGSSSLNFDLSRLSTYNFAGFAWA